MAHGKHEETEECISGGEGQSLGRCGDDVFMFSFFFFLFFFVLFLNAISGLDRICCAPFPVGFNVLCFASSCYSMVDCQVTTRGIFRDENTHFASRLGYVQYYPKF